MHSCTTRTPSSPIGPPCSSSGPGAAPGSSESCRGHFRFVLNDDTREIQLLLGRDYDRPLASRRAGSLELTDGPDALSFKVDRLPDTSYVRDFRAQQESGAAVFGVAALFRIPPPATVPDALSYAPEAAAKAGPSSRL